MRQKTKKATKRSLRKKVKTLRANKRKNKNLRSKKSKTTSVKKIYKKVVNHKNPVVAPPAPEPTTVTPAETAPAPATVTTTPAPGKKPRKHNYLNNKDMLHQISLSKKQGKMTNELAKMLQTLAAHYARRGNFVNYTYNEDMQAYAVMMLVRTWNSFNPAKSKNPFAFFTQCIKHSFIQFLNQEKRQRDIRDELMVKGGLNPSHSYMEQHSTSSSNDGDSDNEQTTQQESQSSDEGEGEQKEENA